MSKVNLGAGAPKKGRRRAQTKIMPEKYERKKDPLEDLFGLRVGSGKVYRGGGMVKKRKK